MYEFLAELTLVFHFIFILYVVLGGLLFFVIRINPYVHIPSVIWGTYTELTCTICPLTYLENWFLEKGGTETYTGDFIQNYLVTIVYPINLSKQMQTNLGLMLIFLNIFIYGMIIIKCKKNK